MGSLSPQAPSLGSQPPRPGEGEGRAMRSKEEIEEKLKEVMRNLEYHVRMGNIQYVYSLTVVKVVLEWVLGERDDI